MNLNKVILIGRLAADPESRSTNSGQQVTNFSIATNRIWTNQSGEKQEQVEFHRIVAWGRLADIVSQYLKKGGLVMVEGHLQTRSWVGQDEVKRYQTEIVAENIQMGPRAANQNYEPGQGGQSFPSQTERTVTADTQKQKTKEVDENKDDDIPVVNENEPIVNDDEIEEKEVKVEDIPF